MYLIVQKRAMFGGTLVPTNIACFCTIRYITLSFKKSMSISLDFAINFFKGLLGTLRAPKKKFRLVAPFSGYPGTPKHCRFYTIMYLTLSEKKSMSISLDFA